MKKQLQQIYMPFMFMLTMCLLGSASYAQLFEFRLNEVGINSKEKDLSIMKAIESDSEFIVGSTIYYSNTEIMRLKRITDGGAIVWSKDYPGLRNSNSRFFSFVEILNGDNFEIVVSGYSKDSLDTTANRNIKRLTLWWIDAGNGSIIKSHMFQNFSENNVYGLNIEVSPYNQDLYITGLMSPDYIVDSTSSKESFAMRINYNADLIWAKKFNSGVHPDSSVCATDFDALNHIAFGNPDELYLIGNSNYDLVDSIFHCNKLKAQLLKLNVNDGSLIWENKHSLGGNAEWNVGLRGINRAEGLVVIENNSKDRNFSLVEFDNGGGITNAFNYDIIINNKIENAYAYNIKEDESFYYVTGLIDNKLDSNFTDTGSLFIYKIDKATFIADTVTIFPLNADWYLANNIGDYFRDYLKLFPLAYYPENSDLYGDYIYAVAAGRDNFNYERVIIKDNDLLDRICTNVHPDSYSYLVNYDSYDEMIFDDNSPDKLEGPEKVFSNNFNRQLCFTVDSVERNLSVPFEGGFKGYKIYPNPNYGNFFIQGDEIIKIEVYDTKGQLIYGTNKLDDQILNIHTFDWANGVYLIKLYEKYKVSQEKVIVINANK